MNRMIYSGIQSARGRFICSGNVLTVRSLLERLVKWAFPEHQGEEMMSNLLAMCSQLDWSSMSDGGRFAAWLYARWVVAVDIAARFPDPLPRATVSNPYVSSHL